MLKQLPSLALVPALEEVRHAPALARFIPEYALLPAQFPVRVALHLPALGPTVVESVRTGSCQIMIFIFLFIR